MAGVVLLGSADAATAALAAALRERLDDGSLTVETAAAGDLADRLPDAVIYFAAARGDGDRPDPEDARRLLDIRTAGRALRLVVIASAAIVVPDHHHSGMVDESYRGSTGHRRSHPIARAWRDLEAMVDEAAESRPEIDATVLRPTAMPVAGGRDVWSRLFASNRRFAPAPAGFDPAIQLLAVDDLATAVARALGLPSAGGQPPERFHIVPDATVLLHSAMRLAGVRRVPIPGVLLRLLALRHFGRRDNTVAYQSHAWTISGTKTSERLGFTPQASSAMTALRLRAPRAPRRLRIDRWVATPSRAASSATSEAASRVPTPARVAATADLRWGPRDEAPPADWHLRFDDFGMDERFLRFTERTLGGFLHDRYWRIELAGLEHLPRHGPAVLVGVHRGFMPFDGVMAVMAARRATGRTPRFLIHPSLVKFPGLASAMIKLGGIHANRKNADRILRRDDLLAVFPEGIRGAFSDYRDVYRLKRFGRNEFVRMALANSAPIVPFVTVGSAEIFPILGKLRWRWWQRLSEWPCLPITPTFPLLPVPLPSKWHTRFLPPIDLRARYNADAAHEPATVRTIGNHVRQQMTVAIDEMLAARRSIFYGNIFPPLAPDDPEQMP